MTRRTGLPPLEPASAKLLILGSIPGVASLDAQQYYAHRYNFFWPIMQELFGVPRDTAYNVRLQGLLDRGIALWDVLERCDRAGSLDTSIVRGSEIPNDIAALLVRHPGLRAIALNGRVAEAAFRRHLLPALGARLEGIALIALPSTSPANASRSASSKLQAWSALREYSLNGAPRP